MTKTIPLGFEVGTGEPVSIPVGHTVITGQTQQAGKTTALEALIARSGLKAVAFVTKRGEGSFANARTIPPYFREQADWKFVASILEASRGEKMKFERSWIIKVSRGAHTLADVQRNVKRALLTAKGINEGVYTVLEAYLEDVVPLINKVNWAKRVVLSPGLNVVDMTSLNVEMQHLVIRSTIEWVLEHEENTVVIVPEAWKFIPQGRGTPVKLAAESFIRQAAGLRNYLWLDSQDIAGVEKLILKSVPIWILGVQRESNEVKRTLAQIPAGIKKPKLDEIATLGLGQFFVCHGTHITKVYVQPERMDASQAKQIALGKEDAHAWADATRRIASRRPEPTIEEDTVKESEARELRETNERLARENGELRKRLDGLEAKHFLANSRSADVAPAKRADVEVPVHAGNGVVDESLYQAIKTRLIDELPSDSRVLRIVTMRPELRVEVERHVVEVDATSPRGRIARLIANEFFSKARTSTEVNDELERRGSRLSNIEIGNAMKELTEMGFFTRENKWYTFDPSMKVNVIQR